MAIFPYKFSSDESLKPKTQKNTTKSKEVKTMACKTKKTSKKTGKKGGK